VSPIAHAELGWLLAVPVARDRRGRVWGAVAGVLPDLDGLTLAAYPWDQGAAYGRWHHLLTHGIVAALGVAGLAFALGGATRLRIALLALASFHLHLLCDLMGSGREWPIAYLWPFSGRMVQPFRWGWELASWQNASIALVASFAILAVGAARGFSIIELFSRRGDVVFVQVLQTWRARLGGGGAA
jgi:hypothetical protein